MSNILARYKGTSRTRLIKIGEGFGSSDTLAQADQTLLALETYHEDLANFGFIREDIDLLKEAREGLVTAGVKRETVKGSKKVTNNALHDAEKEAKRLRLHVKAILDNVQKSLQDDNEEQHAPAINEIAAVQGQTRSAGGDPSTLATQLTLLKTTLHDPRIAPEATRRGASNALVDQLGASITKLREFDQRTAHTAGTPEETQNLDLLDGVIVTLTRRARKSALAASKAIGNPAMGKAFELTQLYSGKKKSDTTDEPTPT